MIATNFRFLFCLINNNSNLNLKAVIHFVKQLFSAIQSNLILRIELDILKVWSL